MNRNDEFICIMLCLVFTALLYPAIFTYVYFDFDMLYHYVWLHIFGLICWTALLFNREFECTVPQSAVVALLFVILVLQDQRVFGFSRVLYIAVSVLLIGTMILFLRRYIR